ncbi:MAG: DUF2243 domain-containing protein [Chitinophagaceae bacterium]|nr:MAG: DUF2243 domain-containing protein [Chitinophagaceae bacterium]
MNRQPLITAGTIIGIGMGGFLDGILFHQVLQIHSMLSSTLPQDQLVNVKVSMVWDGLFHLLTWITTAIGLAMLWRAGKTRDCPWSGQTFWGGLIMGWGIFNVVEGIIDHYILGIHHVVELYGLSVYDHIFVASGIVFIVIGIILIRRSAKSISSRPV